MNPFLWDWSFPINKSKTTFDPISPSSKGRGDDVEERSEVGVWLTNVIKLRKFVGDEGTFRNKVWPCSSLWKLLRLSHPDNLIFGEYAMSSQKTWEHLINASTWQPFHHVTKLRHHYFHFSPIHPKRITIEAKTAYFSCCFFLLSIRQKPVNFISELEK